MINAIVRTRCKGEQTLHVQALAGISGFWVSRSCGAVLSTFDSRLGITYLYCVVNMYSWRHTVN